MALRNNRMVSNRTHQVVGEGCDTCGVCHPNRCFSCDGGGYRCSTKSDNFIPMSRTYSGFEGSGQTPLNVQPQWSNDGTRDQVFVGMDGSSEGYGSIFSQKNYWIGVVAGVVGLMAYQKYVK
jgi:hypothetical protein